MSSCYSINGFIDSITKIGLPSASLFASLVLGFMSWNIAREQKNIAREQKDTAKNKLTFDLFERRYQIFLDIQNLVNEALGQHSNLGDWKTTKYVDIPSKIFI